jgi:hypothetical protein
MSEADQTGAERSTPPTSSRLDRVGPRRPAVDRVRDGSGTEALYSTAPTAAPTAQVELRCRRCDVPFGLSVLGTMKLLTPPFLVDPVRGRLWTRCPACEHRAWLDVRTGQALRVLLEGRRPR